MKNGGSTSSPRKVGVALYGAGTVGGSVLQALKQLGGHYAATSGVRFDVRHVVTRKRRTGPWPYTTSLQKPLADPAVDLVVEVMGGEHPALEVIEQALSAGKSVVTANKEVIAKHGKKLLTKKTYQNGQGGVPLYYEASVAGGIPVIAPLMTSLRSSRIQRLMGILNGTTNYILTRMQNEGAAQADILKQAQELGYAEADASFDVDGHDALHKLTILASLVSGCFLDWRKLHREGIAKITDLDIQYAEELGYRIKLLALVQPAGKDAIDARVHPALLPMNHPLAKVDGVLNGVYLEGEPLGPLMLVGEGAGGGPTAASVVADMIKAATSPAPPALWRTGVKPVPIGDTESRFYLRMRAKDQPGTLARVSEILGRHGVSIHSILQKGSARGVAQIVWVTHRVKESALQSSLAEIKKRKVIVGVDVMLRVEEDLNA